MDILVLSAAVKPPQYWSINHQACWVIPVDDIEIIYFGRIRSSSEGKIVLDCNISSSALLTPAMRGLSLLSAAPLHPRSKVIQTKTSTSTLVLSVNKEDQTGPFLFAVFVQVNWQLLKLTKLDYTSLKTDTDNGSCCQKMIASCREEEKLNQKSCGWPDQQSNNQTKWFMK